MSQALDNSMCIAQVRLWQALCILCPFVADDEVAVALQTVWDMLLVSICFYHAVTANVIRMGAVQAGKPSTCSRARLTLRSLLVFL